jgi:hypothetical protein
MTYAFSNTYAGSLISTGAQRVLPLEFIPDYFVLINETNQSSIANPAVVKRALKMPGQADGGAYLTKNTAGAATDESSVITSGGFYAFDSSQTGLEASKPITSVSQAASALVTVASHNYIVGDIIRFFNVTNMQQIGSMDFEILTVPSVNTFTIPLDSSAFAAAGAGGQVRRHKSRGLFVPKHRYITKITQAAQAVVTTSTAHGYVTGQYVRVNVDASFGMYQINGQLLKATVLSDTTFSLAVDSTLFSPFAFPVSAAFPFQFPTVTPAVSLGVAATIAVPFDPFNLVEVRPAFTNRGYFGIVLGSQVCGAANDVLRFFAAKGDAFTAFN